MKKKGRLLLYSSLHGVLLVFLTLLINSSDIVHWDDEELVWVNNFLKKFILKVDEKPNPDDYIFINVSYDNELVNKYDENGFLLGNQDITDRKKLADFFNAANQADQHQAILCDIRFMDPSPHDSLLKNALYKTNNLICSYHEKTDKSPVFDSLPFGLSDYKDSGGFLKYRFSNHESIKSSPLKLFETVSGKSISYNNWFIRYDNHYYMNNCILDLRIRDFDLKTNRNVSDSAGFHAKYVQLGDLLKLDSLLGGNYISQEIKDRIVIMGDFEDRDLHDSVMGSLPGPILLTNAYLSLKFGDNKISVGLILFLLISYTLLSYFIFNPSDIKIKLPNRIRFLRHFNVIFELLGYLFVLFLISFTSYLFFDLQFSIIIIALYIKLVDWLLDIIRNDKKHFSKR